MFELERLSFSYNGLGVLSIRAFHVRTGEIVAIQGDNGTGKTTLLKLLAGILREQSGKFLYRDIGQVRDRTIKLREDVVFVHQNPYLFSGSVYRNVASAVNPKRGRSAIRKTVSESLERLGMGGFEHRKVRMLSGGEIKRVALARALAADPKVLLLDEPTASIDGPTTERIIEFIQNLSAEQRTVILSTHNPEIAYRISDRLVHLSNGDIAPVNLNILRGKVEKIDSSFLYFSSGGCEFKCPVRDGAYTAAVMPFDDIILSEDQVDTSAQNQIYGTVVDIHKIGERFRICLDCGVKIYSHITARSLSQMHIAPGKKLYAVFKASSVQLY